MKFLAVEAKGIEPLVATSPFMSWLYTLFSVQGASNLIGMYDVFFALLLGLGLALNRTRFIVFAMLGCGAVFFMTQTFIFTAQGAFRSETGLARLGLFVIKDIWFICDLAVIARLSQTVR